MGNLVQYEVQPVQPIFELFLTTIDVILEAVNQFGRSEGAKPLNNLAVDRIYGVRILLRGCKFAFQPPP